MSSAPRCEQCGKRHKHHIPSTVEADGFEYIPTPRQTTNKENNDGQDPS